MGLRRASGSIVSKNSGKGSWARSWRPIPWPTRIKFRKLHVAVDNSVWLHQLLYLKATLLENIQTQMEELQLEDIIFRIGEIPETREDTVDEHAGQAPVSSDARKTARDFTQSVNDDELRDSLTRVIAQALSSTSYRIYGRQLRPVVDGKSAREWYRQS